MNRLLIAALAVAACSFSVQAQEGIVCLNCHVPEEDWEGMSPREILQGATEATSKRHAVNAKFTEQQLKAMIAQMLGGDG